MGTAALTLQWVVSSSSCTSFWLLPSLSLWPRLSWLSLKQILCNTTPPTATPTSTDLTTPLDTLDLSLAPVTSPSIVSTRERPRPTLATATTTVPTPLSTTPTPTGPE